MLKSTRTQVAATLRAAATRLSASSSDDEKVLSFLTTIEAWRDGDAAEPNWDAMYPIMRRLREKLHVQALPELLETELLRTINEAYAEFKRRGRKEPNLTAALLREVINNPGQGWTDIPKAKQTAYIELALKRLKAKGKLVTSLGIGQTGREARFWEPA
jgi:inactivated superfamily I helicase